MALRQSKGELIEGTDGWITIRVISKIANDYSLQDAGIHAEVNAGVVSLSGEVSSLMTSAQASWTVWQIPGVKSVKNDLTVKEKAKDFTPTTRTAEVAQFHEEAVPAVGKTDPAKTLK